MQLLLYKNVCYIFAINLILMVIFLMVLWKHGGDRVLNQPLKPMLLHKSDQYQKVQDTFISSNLTATEPYYTTGVVVPATKTSVLFSTQK
jgi:hypothetical protein